MKKIDLSSLALVTALTAGLCVVLLLVAGIVNSTGADRLNTGWQWVASFIRIALSAAGLVLLVGLALTARGPIDRVAACIPGTLCVLGSAAIGGVGEWGTPISMALVIVAALVVAGWAPRVPQAEEPPPPPPPPPPAQSS